MPYDEICLEAEEKMDGSVNHLGHTFRGIRTGRASPSHFTLGHVPLRQGRFRARGERGGVEPQLDLAQLGDQVAIHKSGSNSPLCRLLYLLLSVSLLIY